MITEVARVTVREGNGPAFEAAVAEAEHVLSEAKGWIGVTLQRCIEDPSQYIVLIRWETVDNHMSDFREGPLFADWRALVGPHFAAPPEVLHYDTVLGFGSGQ